MGLKSKDNTFIYSPSAKADGKETCKGGCHSVCFLAYINDIELKQTARKPEKPSDTRT